LPLCNKIIGLDETYIFTLKRSPPKYNNLWKRRHLMVLKCSAGRMHCANSQSPLEVLEFEFQIKLELFLYSKGGKKL
jgi:hypothetical protein